MSQQQLADSAGISLRTLRSIERGATSRPQRHSLTCLARAFGFTTAQTATFLASAAPNPTTSRLAPVVGRSLDVDAYLGTGQRPLNSATRVVSSNARMTIGPDRLSHYLDHSLLLEGRDHPVAHHWLLWGDDPSLDLDAVSADVTIGGTVAALLRIPGHDLLALRVALDPVLRPGVMHEVGVRWEFRHLADFPPASEPDFAMGWRDVPHLATVSVTFVDPSAPRRLWTTAGANPADLRVEGPISLDPTGSASVTRHVTAPGMVGISWTWS